MLDSWEPLEAYACPRCGGIDWDSEPKWRYVSEEERQRTGWVRIPVLSPDKSTCLKCGMVIVFASQT